VAEKDEVHALYGLRPAEFTAARNALVKRWKASGYPERAAAVKALVRPSVTVWALNQTARRHPDALAALEAASARLRAAHTGARDGDELRAALGEVRVATMRVIDLARQLLGEEMSAVTPALARRMQTTLTGALAGGTELQTRLRRGMLACDLEAGGFDALAGVAPAPIPAGRGTRSPKETAPGRPRGEPEPARAKDARHAAELVREALTREREADFAERRARSVADQAAVAAREAEAARERARRARAEADRATRATRDQSPK
jgi:hypothetical protein